jgi:protein O-mannosyl-transferase
VTIEAGVAGTVDGASTRKDEMKIQLPDWFFPGILVLIAVMVNLPTLRNSFTLEDRQFLMEDARIPALSEPGAIWGRAGVVGDGPHGAGYQPLTVLSFALNEASGTQGRGYHAVNLGLHLIVVLLVFGLTEDLLGDRMLAFASALLFALHPAHTESLQRVQERGGLLAAAALIAALWISCRGRKSWVTAAAVVLLYVAALLSTPASVAFLGIWALVAVHSSREPLLSGRIRQLVADIRCWLLLAATLAYFLVVRLLPGPVQPVEFVANPLAFAHAGARFLTAVYVTFRYFLILVWPYRLSPDYSYDVVPVLSSIFTWELLLSTAVLGTLIAAAVWITRRKPVYLFALLFFLISISAVSNLIFPVGRIMCEAFLYLPSLAICWALAQLIKDLGWLPRAGKHGETAGGVVKPLALILVALLFPWGAKTYMRNAEWKTDRTLYRAAVRTSPRSARAHFLLGNAYLTEGDRFGAERESYYALQIYPGYARAAIQLAAAYESLDRFPKALTLLESFAGKSAPFEGDRLRELGRVYLGMGEYQRAAESYESALNCNGRDAESHRELGILYRNFLNQPDKGSAHIERSRQLTPRAVPDGR